MSDSRTKNVSRNIFFGVIYKVVTLLFPFVTKTLLLYLMGTSSVGISTLFSSILSFLSLAELGFGSAIVHSMYKPIADNDLEAVGAILNFYKRLYRTIGTVIFGVGCLLIPFLPFLTKGEAPQGTSIYILYFIYLTNSVISYFFAGYRQSLLIGHQRSDIKDKIAMLVMIVVRFTEVLVIVATRNLYLYACVAILGTILTNTITAVVTHRMYPEIQCKGTISKEQRALITRKLSGLFGTKLNAIVVHQADTLVISAVLGLTVQAQYGFYYMILNAVSGFIMIIFSSMTSSIGNKIVKDTRDSVYALFRKINFINSWIVGWCAICMVCLYQPFMEIWIGKELMFPLSTAVCLSLYLYIYQIQRTILTFKDAAGLWYEDRYRPYISMVINVVSNLILIQIIGINGVVLSTVLAFLISVPWCNHIVFRSIFQMSPWINLRQMLLTFAQTAAAALATYLVCGLFGTGILALLGRLVVCAIVPNLLFLALCHKKPEFRYLLEMVQSILKRGKLK